MLIGPLGGPSSGAGASCARPPPAREDRKSTRLNSSHLGISYAVFCLKKKNQIAQNDRVGRSKNVCQRRRHRKALDENANAALMARHRVQERHIKRYRANGRRMLLDTE